MSNGREMEISQMLFMSITRVVALRCAYIAWFKPEEDFKILAKSMKRMERLFPLVVKIRTARMITKHRANKM